MLRFPVVLRLSRTEFYVLVEAVRLAQQDSFETSDRFNPALSRVQRKLGQEAGMD
jgi:hypothetical protein